MASEDEECCLLFLSYYFTENSINQWLSEQNVENLDELPVYVVSQLMEYLNLAPYLHELSCNRHISPWSPNYDGWMKGESMKYLFSRF